MKQKAGNRHRYARVQGKLKRDAYADRGEPFARRPIVIAALAAAGALGSNSAAWGAPTGGQITAGTGAIAAAPNANGGTNTVIRQNGNRLAIDWNSFDIGTKDTVTFYQPTSGAIALNRVTSQSATQILGTLNANGQVFILNPNGVLFGKSAQVNVGGLLASTLNLSDSDFLAGKFRFTESGGTGSIVNQGSITANGGYIAFIAPHVSNQGTLAADRGTVALAAGAAATVTFAGNQLVSLTVDQGTLDALAENGDLIRADGGVVILTSKGRDAVLSGVVNNTGEIRARTAVNQSGTIRLLADGGTTLAGGTLDASAPVGGNGGTIETSGQAFDLQSGATITTRAASGKNGTWLIDPSDITVAASGGSMTGAALSSQLANTNVQLQTSTGTGGSGDITISDNVAWASGNTLTLTADRDILVSGTLNASTTGSLVANATRNVSLTGAITAQSLSATASNGNIGIAAPITLDTSSGTLTLWAVGTVTPGPNASVTTGTFNLQSGAWTQVGTGSLPSFSASNFEVGNGGSFLRALSGSGIAGDPYLIGDVYGLQGIGTSTPLLGSSYKLANSIDASGTANWNGGAGFAPIGGTIESAFMGTFDGNGKTISGLSISRGNTEDVGLFGIVRDGTVSNVSLTNFSVVGSRFVGALEGLNEGGTISNVSVDQGTVTATSSTLPGDTSGKTSVGGLVGENLSDGASFPATINNASVGSGVTVTASGSGGTVEGQVGGLVGWMSGGVLSHSKSAASVTGDVVVGGLVGQNDGTVDSSSASGAVTANNNTAGGLVGANTSTIATSSAAGAVNASQDAAGLVGINSDGGQITSSWASGAVSGFTVAGGLVGENDGSIAQSFSSSSVSLIGGTAGGLVGLNNGTIADSYALGATMALNGVAGGLVGDNENSIVRSYAAGLVRGRDGWGGLVAVAGAGASVTNSYWNTDTTGLTTTVGSGTGLTNAQMLTSTAASFAGFDFSGVWRFIPGTSYPYLASIFTSTPTVFSGTYTKASGAVNAGKTVDFAANDQLIGSVTTGANGFYYLMLPSSAFNGTTAVAVFAPKGTGTALGAAETAGASVAMDLKDNVVAMAGSSVNLGDIAAALGNPFSGAPLSPVASLVPAVLTNLQSNALATASGVSLVFGPGTMLALTGDTTMSAASMTLGSVSGSGSTLTLATSGGDITQGGAFSLGALGITGAGNVTLNDANQIGTVAANVSGSFSLGNAADLAVGQVGSTAGITAGGPVTLSASGHTIKLDQGITSSASGDAVVLASAGFTNLDGPGAIAASLGRWLIASSSPDADVFGGLQSGNDALWGQSYTAGSTVAALGNRYLFSADQVILVNAQPNRKTVGETAQESATLSLKYAGSSYGNAFTDAGVPTGVSVSVYSNGDAASATRAGGDDGVGRYRIRYTASGVAAGFTVADGTVADLTVADPPVAQTAPSTAPASPGGSTGGSTGSSTGGNPGATTTAALQPAVIDQIQAITDSDVDTGNQRMKLRGAVLAALGASQATRVGNSSTASAKPAWPVAEACTP